MSLDPSALFVGLLTGAVGFVLLVYCRKQRRLPQIIGGALFCIYPYFCESAVSMILVGMALGLAVWVAIRLGW